MNPSNKSRRKKSLVGHAHLRYNFVTKDWDLVKMLNPDGAWGLFHSKECADKSCYISARLTGGVVKDKIVKVKITIEEI